MKVLNVGGNSKAIPLPSLYSDYTQVLLDIDPRGDPDIVCDARELESLAPAQFDAVYCSNNVEHYYRHDVPRVLRGILHVLKDAGFAHIRAPNLLGIMRSVHERGLDLEDVLYQSRAGPITVLDVIYGYGPEIVRSGQDFFAHKTGFSASTLNRALNVAGFGEVYVSADDLEVAAFAFKGRASDEMIERLGLAKV